MTEHPVQEFISELYRQDEDVRRGAAQLLCIDPESGVETFLDDALSNCRSGLTCSLILSDL